MQHPIPGGRAVSPLCLTTAWLTWLDVPSLAALLGPGDVPWDHHSLAGPAVLSKSSFAEQGWTQTLEERLVRTDDHIVTFGSWVLTPPHPTQILQSHFSLSHAMIACCRRKHTCPKIQL